MSKEQEALQRIRTIMTPYDAYKSFTRSKEPFDKDCDILEQTLDDYELYKKAFEMVMTDFYPLNELSMKDMYLDQARKEVNNGKY